MVADASTWDAGHFRRRLRRTPIAAMHYALARLRGDLRSHPQLRLTDAEARTIASFRSDSRAGPAGVTAAPERRMPSMRLASCLAVSCLALLACDPEVGSEVECEPAPLPGGPAGDASAVPTEDAALQAWLVGGTYQGWLAESGPHASRGPHGGDVRTFVSPSLAGSLAACAPSHPVGSAMVKELHGSNGVTGWAVMVKTRAAAGADSWFWYEVFSTAPDAKPGFSGQGDDTCTGCHDAGLDAVRTRWPLQ